MQRIYNQVKNQCENLLADGIVSRVIGWKSGEFLYDETPWIFTTPEELKDLVYDGFSGANLSKYIVNESKKEERIAVLLKPCDTYSFNQLVKENHINRNNVYAVGIECEGTLDIDKIKDKGVKGITGIKEDGEELLIHTIYGDKSCKRSEVLLERCQNCKGKTHVVYDELIVSEKEENKLKKEVDRFELVGKLEAMSPDERFEFWRGELSKCIRCNACRNVCPACTCTKCVFDNDNSGMASKANTDAFEEKLFHLIRAYHVAGRCTDCGECSRVCPQHIPLHLLNRKYIKDINEFYGEYQAGADNTCRSPLTDYNLDDIDPSIVSDKGGER